MESASVTAGRINHRHGINGRRPDNVPSFHTVKPSLILNRLRKLLYELQNQRRGDPLVGVVSSGIDHLPIALPDGKSSHRPSKRCCRQHLRPQEWICIHQLQYGFLAKRGGHWYIGSHDSQNITSGQDMQQRPGLCSSFPEHNEKAPSNRMEPFKCWHYLSSRAVTRQVLSALVSLTSVFGMGTGGPSQQSIPTHMDDVFRHRLLSKAFRLLTALS